MYPTIEFNPAAFRHGVDENKYLVIGFDPAGKLLEVMYNVVDDQTINVFHAMKCRKAFYPLLLDRSNYGQDDR
jgi:hypothetical protein